MLFDQKCDLSHLCFVGCSQTFFSLCAIHTVGFISGEFEIHPAVDHASIAVTVQRLSLWTNARIVVRIVNKIFGKVAMLRLRSFELFCRLGFIGDGIGE